MRGKAVEAVPSAEERAFLEAHVRKHKAPRSLSDRCRIVLLCAEGLRSREVAERAGVHGHTVGKRRRRFAERRIEGLSDECRSGRPRTVTDEKAAEAGGRTPTAMPKDATRWPVRSMAGRTGASHATARRIRSASSLKPHRSGTFKLSTDPLFVDKVQDIAGLCMAPPDRAVVPFVDGKPRTRALDRTQPVLPMAPGAAGRRTRDCVRHGTTTLFAALDVATGAAAGKRFGRHRATEFPGFLKEVEAAVPDGLDVHLATVSHATHKTEKARKRLARRRHWHVHFTPASASWLNRVGRWFAEPTGRKLQRSAHRSAAELEADIMSFIDAHNENPRPCKWVKSADETLASVRRFRLKMSGPGASENV